MGTQRKSIANVSLNREQFYLFIQIKSICRGVCIGCGGKFRDVTCPFNKIRNVNNDRLRFMNGKKRFVKTAGFYLRSIGDVYISEGRVQKGKCSALGVHLVALERSSRGTDT